MKHIFINSFLLLISWVCYGQNVALTSITGRTIDDHNNYIAFVAISLTADPSIGTYSNSTGQFQILVNAENVDSLKFSCIGYEDVVIPLQRITSFKDSLIILLKSKVYILEAVEISPDTALEIVRRSVEKLKDNLATDKSLLQGFYREVIRSDYTYDRLIEAAVDIFDPGYLKKEMQFKVREIRKSEDYRDMDWQMSILNYIQPINGLNGEYESLFANDYIRKNSSHYFSISNGPLNEKFFNDVLFRVDSMTQVEGEEVFKIGIHSYEKNEGPKGSLYIRKKDLAILQMEYQYDREPGTFLVVPGETFMHKTIIKYKEYNGKFYLSFLYRKSFRPELNGTKYDEAEKRGKAVEGLFYIESFFVTNEIVTEKHKAKSFRRKERQGEGIDLYTTDWKYNAEFWRSYNTIAERPLEPSVKKDIERETSLDDQFKKNSH